MESIDTWEDPPARVHERISPPQRYVEVVEQLRENKGKWARLTPRPDSQAAKSLAANIRSGRLASFAPEGAYEAKHDGVIVWVRYLGEPDGVDAPRKHVRPDPGVARAVRTWARATGRPVNDRGNVPTDLIAAWQRATRGEEA